MDLHGKVVFITGAARGIGAETARRLAAAGAKLMLTGLEPDRLQALAGELGPDARHLECDVTDSAALERAVTATLDAFGRIDIVLANAGVANNGTVAVNPADALARTIEVNLIGVMRTASATLSALTERRGYLLLVSSAAAFTVLPGMAAYCASKAGVEQFGNALRLEVAHKGVAVGTAHPSWIDTDLVRDQKSDLALFRTTLASLPWPLGTTLPVGACAAALVEGMRRRRSRIYVPRALAGVQALRTIFTGPVGRRLMRGRAARSVPELEREVRELGGSFGAQSAETLARKHAE